MKGLLVVIALVMLASDCWPAEPLSKADRQALASARSAAIRQRGSQQRAAARQNYLGRFQPPPPARLVPGGSSTSFGGGAGREDDKLYRVLRKADFAARTSTKP